MQSFSVDDYRALREGAAFVDRPDRGRIAAVGADRLSYLHAMLTNDIASLAPGSGRYAAYLTPQGRMMADMRVLELGDLTLLDVEGSVTALVIEKLEQFIFSEDVRIVDMTGQLAEVGVYGPRAGDALSAVLAREDSAVSAAALASLKEYQSVRSSFQGGSAVVFSDRDLGVAGFGVFADLDRAATLLARLRDAGVVQAGLEAADVLRVEAGRPRYGVDMDEDTIPLEAGIEPRAISFTKGCYPGQEVITRVVHRGHGRVARKLVGLTCEGAVVPTHGDEIGSGGILGEAAGKIPSDPVGRVTSAVFSPRLRSPIALGYVHRDLVAPGTRVSVVHEETRVPSTVTELPFVHD